MEGTRNERVTVLIISYIIGFITAYIAFGLSQLEEKFVYVPIDAAQTASVIDASSAISSNVTETEAVPAITKEGLVVVKNGEVRVVSASRPAADTILEDGFHVAIADYQMAPNEEYLYFCEVPSVDTDSCKPFIYDITEDAVYPVRLDGERVAFEAGGDDVYWNEDNTLNFE